MTIPEYRATIPKHRKHEEADLHLSFCKWVKKNHPQDQFVRHEREQRRSGFMQGLFKAYNSDLDKLPDFEALITNEFATGLYFEFKKPGTKLTLKDNVTIKPEYANQYSLHCYLWSIGRAVWFVSDLDVAKTLYTQFKQGFIEDRQVFKLPVSKSDQSADEFFNERGL